MQKKISLFIDSNIFLNFYDFYPEDLEHLTQLVELVEKKEIKLFITKQVQREIERQRESRLAEAYNKFKESRVTLDMPVICQAYPEYKKIKEIQCQLFEEQSKLSKGLWEDIINGSLEADKIIKKLFKVANILDSDKVLEKAKVRYALGNPPGKKDKSYGDEINWEALLEFIPSDCHFVIISDDKDYKSPLNENELKEFLIKEWENKKNTKILFYHSLTSFLKDNEINIELRWEEEKNQLIKELIESPNFATTHDIIKKLSKFINFSEEQIRNIGRAVFLNSQVAWIASDSDVKQFYEKYIFPYLKIFTQDEMQKLKNTFYPQEEQEEIPDIEKYSI